MTMSRKTIFYSTTSLLSGMLIGGVITALLTPKKGQDMRAGIRKKVADFRHDIDKTKSDLHEKAKHDIGKLHDEVSDLKDQQNNDQEQIIP